MLRKVRKIIPNKLGLLIYFVLLQFFILIPNANANTPYPLPADQHHFNVLVVYTNSQEQIDENVRNLDVLLGHFTTKINFISDKQVREEDIKGVTHLFYYGISQQKVNPNFIKLINHYDGTLIVIGHNVKQFENRFSFMEAQDQIWVNSVSLYDQQEKEFLEQRLPIYQISGNKEDVKVLLNAWKGDNAFPLFIQYGNTYYYASESLFNKFGTYFGESLYQVFNIQTERKHLAYLRLEDVHPLSDPKFLREIGEYLWQKKIPYLIAVIPVYVDATNKQPIHLKDKPEIVDALTYMQNHGGSILLHGYTHKYKNNETGEGFEFWDVENDRPIFGLEGKNTALKQRHDFNSMQEYQDYLQSLYNFEENYIRDRIEKGIRELVDIGLYPLGFEPPHYTISLEGYKIVSQYFNGFFGQVQLSNSTWKIMGSSPYLTKPKMLNGMLLYPETIGYYDPNSLTPYQDIHEKLQLIKNTRNGMIGFFYHPFLGLTNLKPVIEDLEKVPNLEWIDIKQHKLKVTAPYLEMSSGGKQQPITVADSLTTQQKLMQNLQVSTFELVLWGVVCVVTIMILLFFTYTIILRMRLRKSLFEERDV